MQSLFSLRASRICNPPPSVWDRAKNAPRPHPGLARAGREACVGLIRPCWKLRVSPCRESCHPVPAGRGPGEPPAVPSWCCCSSSILWDKSPVECCSRDEGMIPPPHFTLGHKQKVPQQLITPKLRLPAACPKLQPSRREQTAPRLVSQQGNPAPGSSAPALFCLVRLLLVPREFPEGCRDAVERLGLQAAELWQCCPRLSMARTHYMGGCGQREWSRVCGSSWSPFLLLTHILLYSAFEAESDHTVLGSGILLGCQGLAGVVQQEGLDGSGCF